MDNETILRLCDVNLFMKHCGIKARLLEDGSFETYIDMDRVHHNPYGYLHGGIMITIADIGAGMNARRYMEYPVTMSSDFHFFSNVRSGRIKARFKTVHAGKTTTVLRATVSDDNDKILAEGTFSFFNNLNIHYTGERTELG